MMFDKLFNTTNSQYSKPNLPGRIAYSALIILIGLFCISPLQLAVEQHTALQWLFKWRGERAAPEDTIIVALNSTASEELELHRNTSQWPRSTYAALLERLGEAGARLVVMDIAFREPRDTGEDVVLAQAMAKRKTPLVLFNYLKRQQIPVGNGTIDILQEVPPIPAFAEHADAIGPFTLPKFPANVSHTQLLIHIDDAALVTQPLQAYLLDNIEYTKALLNSLHGSRDTPFRFMDVPNQLYPRLLQNAITPQHFDNAPNVQAGKVPAFIDAILSTSHSPTGDFFINFYGYDRQIKTVNIDEVLSPANYQHDTNWAYETFNNKVVYVGFSDNVQTEQRDAHRTVFSQKNGVDLSGVEISASVFSNLHDGSWLRPSHWALNVLIGLSFALLSLISSLHLNYKLSTLAQGLALAAYGTFAYYLFISHYIWLPIFSNAIVCIICSSVAIAYRYRSNTQRIHAVEHALTQYVPADVARKLSHSFNTLEAEQQLVHGVCLMTDIKGYTRLSENTPPQELHLLMNRYYALLIHEVESRGGIIANIVGDSLLTLWTGPTITPELCQKACDTAFAIANSLKSNPEMDAKLPTCFALHGGQFSLGNLGAQGHFEYSPVGDIINTTSRIEPINRTLETQMLCSTLIAENLERLENNQHIYLRPVGNFPMRNKAEAFPLFMLGENVINKESNTSNNSVTNDNESQFAEALALYDDGQLEAAEEIFKTITENVPNDGPSRYYLDSIRKKR